MLGFTKTEILGAIVGAVAVIVLINLIVDATMSPGTQTAAVTRQAPIKKPISAKPTPKPAPAPKQVVSKEPAPVATPAPAPAPAPAPVAAAPVSSGIDVAAGKAITKKCKTCHTFNEGGKNKVGPNLWGIVGAAKARDGAFKYSGAMASKGGKWTPADLDAFLTKPKTFVTGTKMGFAGLKKATDRANLIGYMATLGGSTAATAPAVKAAAPTQPKAPEPTAKPEPVKTVAETASDIGAGKKLAKKCKACHTFDEGGKNKVGPNLWGVVGATKARDGAFKYSKSMSAKGGTWTAGDLDAFLTKPKTFVPGTKMSFAGLKKAGDRANLIAYLGSLGGTQVAAATAAPSEAEPAPQEPKAEPKVEEMAKVEPKPKPEPAAKGSDEAAPAEEETEEPELTPLRELWEECVGCHGEQAEGSEDTGGPRLNGQQEWYILGQLKKFRAGLRGTDDEKDPNGNMMMGVAEGIEDEALIPAISKFIAELPDVAPQQAVKGGDPVTGKAIYASNCTFCHGDNGEGNEGVGAPRLAGQSDWYVILQLNNFRAGARGAHQGDERGAQMQAMATILPDEQAVMDVGAYISSMK